MKRVPAVLNYTVQRLGCNDGLYHYRASKSLSLTVCNLTFLDTSDRYCMNQRFPTCVICLTLGDPWGKYPSEYR